MRLYLPFQFFLAVGPCFPMRRYLPYQPVSSLAGCPCRAQLAHTINNTLSANSASHGPMWAELKGKMRGCHMTAKLFVRATYKATCAFFRTNVASVDVINHSCRWATEASAIALEQIVCCCMTMRLFCRASYKATQATFIIRSYAASVVVR